MPGDVPISTDMTQVNLYAPKQILTPCVSKVWAYKGLTNKHSRPKLKMLHEI